MSLNESLLSTYLSTRTYDFFWENKAKEILAPEHRQEIVTIQGPPYVFAVSKFDLLPCWTDLTLIKLWYLVH